MTVCSDASLLHTISFEYIDTQHLAAHANVNIYIKHLYYFIHDNIVIVVK